MNLKEYMEEIERIYRKTEQIENQLEDCARIIRSIRIKIDDLPTDPKNIEIDKEEDS